MANPIVLLCVLNILPQSVLEIIAEITALEEGRSHSPFGGSRKIGPHVKGMSIEEGIFTPFHTEESCRNGLLQLVKSQGKVTDWVREDPYGFRITYKGLFLLPAIIRDIRQRNPLPAIPKPIRVFSPKEDDVPWMLSPQQVSDMAKDYKKRYA